MPDHSTCHVGKIQPGKAAKDVANCTTCEAVCCRLIVVLTSEDNVPPHHTTYLPNGLHVMARDEDGWCVAMDRTHMNCGIYANRPDTCRRFAMGGPYCNAIRSDYAKQRSRSIDITLK